MSCDVSNSEPEKVNLPESGGTSPAAEEKLQQMEKEYALLLEKYKTSDTDDCFGDAKPSHHNGGILLMMCLEVLLSEEVYFNQLTDAERTDLYQTLESFYGADRSGALTNGADQSYRFYPYYPAN